MKKLTLLYSDSENGDFQFHVEGGVSETILLYAITLTLALTETEEEKEKE